MGLLQGSNAPPRSLGLDIGSRFAKLAIAQQIADRIDIEAVDSIGIPDGLIVGGVVREPKAFGRLLAERLRPYLTGSEVAVFSVPSNLAMLRWINLPALPSEELRQAAKFKVRRHLPFSVDDAYVEASAPLISEEEQTGSSLVMAVRRDVIDSRAEALLHAGLMPARAELEAQAILRVIERKLSEQSVLWRDASLTIVDVGAANTHMYVVQNQRLQFIRGVKFGGDLFSQAIADALEVSTREAEGLLSNPKTELNAEGRLVLDLHGSPVMVNVHAELNKLTREFLRLLRYFRSLHPERSYAGILDHMIVCGGLVGLRGFAEYLEVYLGLRVERAHPIAGMVAKLNRETFLSISARQEAYTTVMGLALSGLSRHGQIEGDSTYDNEFAWKRVAA